MKGHIKKCLYVYLIASMSSGLSMSIIEHLLIKICTTFSGKCFRTQHTHRTILNYSFYFSWKEYEQMNKSNMWIKYKIKIKEIRRKSGSIGWGQRRRGSQCTAERGWNHGPGGRRIFGQPAKWGCKPGRGKGRGTSHSSFDPLLSMQNNL